MTYTITNNPQYNSIEILFEGKPSEQIRAALKALRFRWHSVKGVWYGYADESAVKAAIEGTPKREAPKEKTNKYGVQVGDIFSASWGYEQTNVDFFQVVELVGEISVRVREVYPNIEESTAISSMSEDRVYRLTKDLLPPAQRSTFIKDQEKGDIKRITLAYNGEAKFKLDSFANAYICKGDTVKEYVSWYA